MSYVKSSIACQKLGCHAETLRNWDRRGYIDTIRTASNYRLYNVDKFIADQRKTIVKNEPDKEKFIYCRVSCRKQKDDLERQISDLSAKYPNHIVYKEIGSGINFKREQLYRILDLSFKGLVSEVVVAHRDRLCRIAWEHFEWLFNRLGVKLVVESNEISEQSPNEELADDLMSIVHVFACRHYGARRKIRKKVNETSEIKDITKT